MELYNMMKCTAVGAFHQKNNLNCQDQVICKIEGNKVAAVLADGIGKTNANAEYGIEMVEEVCDYLLENIEKLEKMRNSQIITTILLVVHRVIKKYMERYSLKCEQVEEFASTLLVICIDLEKEQYLALHLGDGIIICKEKTGNARVISYPFQGRSMQETCLTTSQNLLDYVKIRRGKMENITGILMCSDGVYESNPQLCNPERIWDITNNIEELVQKQDDQAMIQFLFQ